MASRSGPIGPRECASIFVSLFLRHFGERVIRRSPSPSPTLTVSFTDSSTSNDDTSCAGARRGTPSTATHHGRGTRYCTGRTQTEPSYIPILDHWLPPAGSML